MGKISFPYHSPSCHRNWVKFQSVPRGLTTVKAEAVFARTRAPNPWMKTSKSPMQNRKGKPFGPSLCAWFYFLLQSNFFPFSSSCLFVNRCTLEGSCCLEAMFSTDTAAARRTCWNRSAKLVSTARWATSCQRVSNLGKAGNVGAEEPCHPKVCLWHELG